MMVARHEVKWLSALDHLASTFSTCSKRQYASVILAPNKRVLGFGYNGSPPGMGHCNEGYCPRLHEASLNGTQYDNCIAQHAEAGALLWSDPAQRVGSTLVVNGPPCMGCAKLIASSGVARVVCKYDASYAQWESVKEFLTTCNVEVVAIKAITDDRIY
jgi:dCMP deaminase